MANYKKLLQRRHKDDEDTAFAFQEFIQTFQNTTPTAKTFIKSGVYNPSSSQTDDDSSLEGQGRLYTPAMPMHKSQSQDTNKKAIECARMLKVKCANFPKPKSNLEQLKEELQLRHQHVERPSATTSSTNSSLRKKESSIDADALETTTNLFLTSLNPNLNEQDLMQIFGVYGPLASVKIMWPRVPEHNRSSNIGFVGFMSRKDSERAFYSLGNRQDMRVAWGKPIEIPSQPIYIPPEMLRLMLPPAYSGLPFNAQLPCTIDQNESNDVDLHDTLVKVTIPLDKRVLCIIHRTIEFVIREGPLFEAMIMNKEITNPLYTFLFDNKSPDHVYYRWKLFSIMNGESPNNWSTKPFRMFHTGSVWIPPTIPDYTKGMSVKVANETTVIRLSDADQGKLIDLIQYLTPNRAKIADAMLFCLDKINAARDIVNIIAESFESQQGPRRPIKMTARLYLISDILYNAKFKKSSQYADFFEKKLPGIFTLVNDMLKQLLRQDPEQEAQFVCAIRAKLMKVLRAWEMWRLFSNEFIYRLERQISNGTQSLVQAQELNEEHDPPLAPLDGKTLLENASVKMPEEVQLQETKNDEFYYSNFIKSKWETLDPSELEAQAMSTQRMHQMEMERKSEKEKHVSHLSYEELRKVEMKVIRYQDDLEIGERRLKYCNTIDDEVKEFRRRCIDKLRKKKNKT